MVRLTEDRSGYGRDGGIPQCGRPVVRLMTKRTKGRRRGPCPRGLRPDPRVGHKGKGPFAGSHTIRELYVDDRLSWLLPSLLSCLHGTPTKRRLTRAGME